MMECAASFKLQEFLYHSCHWLTRNKRKCSISFRLLWTDYLKLREGKNNPGYFAPYVWDYGENRWWHESWANQFGAIQGIQRGGWLFPSNCLGGCQIWTKILQVDESLLYWSPINITQMNKKWSEAFEIKWTIHKSLPLVPLLYILFFCKDRMDGGKDSGHTWNKPSWWQCGQCVYAWSNHVSILLYWYQGGTEVSCEAWWGVGED